MNWLFAGGTLALVAFLYWAAWRSADVMRNAVITGNLLLSWPEGIFKLVVLGLCSGLASTLAESRTAFGWPPESPWLDIIIGVGAGVGIQVAVNIVSSVAVRYLGKDIYSEKVLQSVTPRNRREWLLTPIPLLLAVLVEEVLFRALLVGGFGIVLGKQLMPGLNPLLPALAVALLSATIFGLMHLPQGTLGVILTGVVGFGLGVVFILTHSLLLVVVIHFTINFMQLLKAGTDKDWLGRFRDDPAPDFAPAETTLPQV